MIILAVAIGTFSVIRTVNILWDAFDGPAIDAPGTTHLDLAAGRWIIFERTGTDENFGPAQRQTNGPNTITVANVEVTDLEGNSQSVRGVTGDQSLTQGSETFTGAVEFSVPTDGRY